MYQGKTHLVPLVRRYLLLVGILMGDFCIRIHPRPLNEGAFFGRFQNAGGLHDFEVFSLIPPAMGYF